MEKPRLDSHQLQLTRFDIDSSSQYSSHQYFRKFLLVAWALLSLLAAGHWNKFGYSGLHHFLVLHVVARSIAILDKKMPVKLRETLK